MEQKLNSLSFESLKSFAKELQEEEIAPALNDLSGDRTIVLIKALPKTELIETVGKHISLQQLYHILEDYPNWTNGQRLKLQPLIVGLSQEHFLNLLKEGEKVHLNVLREESITEPIQHHLTLLIHAIEKDGEEFGNKLHALEGNIKRLDLSNSTREELRKIQLNISSLGQNLKTILSLLNKALAIAWSGGRLDLIERLNTLNINLQRIKKELIGSPRTLLSSPTGLYSLLELKVHDVFGNPLNFYEKEALSDDDPAIEGLVKFSVWYLQDYWDVGLLPNYSKVEEVTLEDCGVSDEEFHSHRKRLFQEVQKNLSQIGLKTVRDLKEANVFSRKTLVEFIASQRRLLDS